MTYLALMGKLRYTDLASNEKALLAHTGLKPSEFEQLCLFFDQAWQRYLRAYTLEGKPRVRTNKGRTNETLPSIEDKLLFVLYYLKTNPLQEVLAAAFSMRQPHASFWLHLLLPRLEEALKRAESLPERQGERLARALEKQKRVLIDGPERPVRRSADYETQKEHYSGKKNDTPS